MVQTAPTPAISHNAAPSEVEQKLLALEAQFGVLKAQVRQAQQLAHLGTAAAVISHEVNNLLTPILNYAQTALACGDQELSKKALTVTVKNVRMLVAMSERVLKISAAKPRDPELTELRSIVDDAAESLCRDLSKDGITFINDVDDVMVFVDPLQLQQIFFNLFLNAREAMASLHSGRLVVKAYSTGGEVVIEVTDTAGGIPTDLIPHLFEPYTSSKGVAADRPPRCGGLGLALCRDLVEENGGRISVASTPDVGTTFTISLPANSGPASA